MDGLTVDQRRLLLVEEAMRWVGIQESGGNNRGQLVEIFLKAAAMPPGNPWCLSFVQFCIQQVDRVALILDGHAMAARTPSGAHCMTFWGASPVEIRDSLPSVGAVVIWRHVGTTAGHAGLVIAADPAKGTFRTIEGNTSPEAGVQRDGDGVFRKSHKLAPPQQAPTPGSMELVGFVLPWGK
jgi:hypothetical protein